jgi:mRNA interferase MazF
MRRGEIRLVDFEPVRGAEADKRRPAIIVSNDGANLAATRLGRGVVTVVPVTSSTARLYPFQVLIEAAKSGLRTDSKAQAEQVRAVAIERVGARLGVVPPSTMREVDNALRLHLVL